MPDALLAAQATQVISAAEPTLVGDLVAAEWDVPAVEDPAWHSPGPVKQTHASEPPRAEEWGRGELYGALLAPEWWVYRRDPRGGRAE